MSGGDVRTRGTAYLGRQDEATDWEQLVVGLEVKKSRALGPSERVARAWHTLRTKKRRFQFFLLAPSFSIYPAFVNGLSISFVWLLAAAVCSFIAATSAVTHS